MKELSLNILDIVQNSISAQATLVKILLAETEDTLRITIEDDGKGMTPEFLATVRADRRRAHPFLQNKGDEP